MNESLRVQESIRKNADELQQYFADMKTWENEIKEKEKQLKQAKCREPNMPFPRNVRPRKEPAPKVDDSLPMKKVKAQAPAPTVTTDEMVNSYQNMQNIDEAFFEKELGNKFVGEQKWAEAIDCYSKAIALDSKNAVYYANRAMCYIKLEKWKLAEVDSTVAIQLDKSYVKAYKRRAFIRKALNHIAGAKADYESVLALEPDCVEARQEIADLNEKMMKKVTPLSAFNYKNMFPTSDSTKVKKVADTAPTPKAFNYKNLFPASKGTKVAIKNAEPVVHKQKTSNAIMPIIKPTHLRSKKPLERVVVKQVEGRGAAWEYFEQTIQPVDDLARDCKTPVAGEAVAPVRVSKPQNIAKPVIDDSKILETLPTTYVQFVAVWGQTAHSHELRYKLLKATCRTLPKVFGSSLEIDILSEIISEMEEQCFLQDDALILSLLQSLSNVERFQSLVLFLSAEDEKRLEKILQKLGKNYPEDVQKLRSAFFS